MAEAIKMGAGGGAVLNAILEEYHVVSDKIRTNTFVEYISELNNNITMSLGKTVYYPMATKLDETRVLLSYNLPSSYSGYFDGMAIIIKIVDENITLGESVTINSLRTHHMKHFLCEGNRVIFIHTGETSQDTLTAKVGTINDMSIMTGSEINLTSSGYSRPEATMIKPVGNNFLLTYAYQQYTTSDHQINMTMLAVSEATINVLYEKKNIFNMTMGNYDSSINFDVIDENTILFFYYYLGLCYWVVDVSNTDFNVLKDYRLVTTLVYRGSYSIRKLSDTKYLFCCASSSPASTVAVIANRIGQDLIVGSAFTLYSNYNSSGIGYAPYAVKCRDNYEVYFAYPPTYPALYYEKISISGDNTITIIQEPRGLDTGGGTPQYYNTLTVVELNEYQKVTIGGQSQLRIILRLVYNGVREITGNTIFGLSQSGRRFGDIIKIYRVKKG